MTEPAVGHTWGFHPRSLALLVALAASALVCAACGGGSGALTGVLEGTASPCVGPQSSSSQRAWAVQVVLRRGSSVVAKRTVLDSQNSGAPVIDELFKFSEPPGSYSVSGATPERQPVVIKAQATSTVQLGADCT